jgi:hypothetical protein
MSPEITALTTLATILIFAVMVDRGVPNVLESIAFGIEGFAELTVTTLRRSSAALRKRHKSIELQNQERLRRGLRRGPVEPVVSSRSSSAAA